MTPELNQKWWSKNKPALAKKTGLGDALKDFQIAREKGDLDDALKKLSALKKKVAEVVQIFIKSKDDDVVTVLKKYPKIIDAEENLIEDQKLKTATSADASKGADTQQGAVAEPIQKIGADVVIWKMDFGEEILKRTKPQWLGKIDGFIFEQRLNSDILDVYEAAGDLVTPQQVQQDSLKVAKNAVKEMVIFIDKLNRAITEGKLTDIKKAESLLETACKTTMEATADTLRRLPEAHWQKFVAKHKVYKKFKFKTNMKLGLGIFSVAAGATGLILGIAATAGAVPTMGGSLPLGIAATVVSFVALCRSTTALAKTIQTLSRSAEKTQKELEKSLNTLRDRYQNASKAKVGGTEMGASAIKGLLGTDNPWIASISKSNDDAKVLSGQTAELAVEQRKMSKAILDLLGLAEDLEKALKSVTDKAARDVYDKLVKARTALSNALDKCSDLGARLKKIEDMLPKLSAMLAVLNSQNPQYAKVFDTVFPLVVSGILIAASTGTGFADASSIADFVTTGASLALDVGGELADLTTT